MLAQKLLGAMAGGSETLYVDDVFSTYLYSGTDAAITINNGVDIAGKGGAVFIKARNQIGTPKFWDTARGGAYQLSTNETSAQAANAGTITFNSNGFSTQSALETSNNRSGYTYVSHTFRKAARFFDCGTYTGNATTRTIPHALGVSPGMVIVKRTDTTSDWFVYHRSSTTTDGHVGLKLNLTDAQGDFGNQHWNLSGMTSSTIGIGNMGNMNASGGTYVWYAFAHDTSAD